MKCTCVGVPMCVYEYVCVLSSRPTCTKAKIGQEFKPISEHVWACRGNQFQGKGLKVCDNDFANVFRGISDFSIKEWS